MTEADGLSALIASRVRDIPDFPKPGVTFKDITPLLDDHAAFTARGGGAGRGRSRRRRQRSWSTRSSAWRPGVSSWRAPVALALGVGFVPVRKPGKLPWKTRAVSYDLEYGSETLEMHTDALEPGERVLVVDDVLATGGTARATAELVEQSGATVHGLAMLLELSFLPGREAIGDLPLTVLHTV